MKENERARDTHKLESQRETLVRRAKENGQVSLRRELTDWRMRKRLIRRVKESQRTKVTHSLERAEGGTSQDNERSERARDTHILESAEGEIRTAKETERKTLTPWRA
jgi:hypothetical protein